MNKRCPFNFKGALDRVDKNTTWTCNHLDVVQLHETRIIVLDIIINIHYKTKTKLTLFRYSTVRPTYAKSKRKQTKGNITDLHINRCVYPLKQVYARYGMSYVYIFDMKIYRKTEV